MPPLRGQLVFCDTNAIIEAFRIRGWTGLASEFKLATVEMCCHEAGRGDSAKRGYIPVDVTLVRETAEVQAVTEREKAKVMLRLSDPSALDPGELELLAHLASRQDSWWVCSPDGACVRAGKELGVLDRFVSLEELLDAIGRNADLRHNFTKQWMSEFRTKLWLEEA